MTKLTEALPRTPELCRSWLFLPGADEEALHNAAASGADVAMQELEDFTPPDLRERARALAPDVLSSWRAAGLVTAARINPLEDDGRKDLPAVMRGRPDMVLMSKVATPEQVVALDRAVSEQEAANGIESGRTGLVPNVESAAGLVRTLAIATASPRVVACLLASEDMAADLGAERGRDGVELAYARGRFLVECTAAGVVAIDCPYTFSDGEGLESEARHARRLGYKAKSAVAPDHARVINRILTPDKEAVAQAERLIAAFEAGRAEGRDRVELDGAMVEAPAYLNAKRLVARAQALEGADLARRP